MKVPGFPILLVGMLALFLPIQTLAQPATWDPALPDPGEVVTITYDANLGTIPAGTTQLKLHWGINETSAGAWQQPPQAIWPEGTLPWSDNIAVQSPMTNLGGGVWQIAIDTHEEIETLHFVVTNGTAWDNNNSQNWNILFGEAPPPPHPTWHTFTYDTRSSLAQYTPDVINSVKVAGEFNQWSTSSHTLVGPDERGIYQLEVQLPAGANPYKFVVHGLQGQVIWIQDPDNPLTDGSQFNNSLVVVEPDTLPVIRFTTPLEGAVFLQGEAIEIAGVVRRADDGALLTENATLTTHPELPVASFDFSPETGAFTALIQPEDQQGSLEILLTVEDENERIGIGDLVLGVFGEGSGFHAVDRIGDATGPGNYTVPEGDPDQVDLTGMRLSEVANGDSLRVEIQLVDHSHYSRVLLQIGTGVSLPFVLSPLAATEVQTPDWDERGVQILLADPASPDLDPQRHNRLAVRRAPLVMGAEVTVNAPFDVTVAMADLEAVLGSYNAAWYFGVYSFLEGPEGTVDGSWEVGEEYGGSGSSADPDAFDLLFTDSPELQRTLLSNWSNNRPATLDHVGRGFVGVESASIGPNMGGTGPVLQFVTRGMTTVRPEKTLYMYTPSQGLLIRINHDWEDGSTEYVAAGQSGQFTRQVTLRPGVNTFQMYTVVAEDTTFSPRLTIFLKTPQKPEIVFNTQVEGTAVILDVSGTTDPQAQDLSFTWSVDPHNPAPVTLENPNSTAPSFTIPVVAGEYYFDLLVEDEDGNVSRGRTFVTVHESGNVTPFTIDRTAQWIQDAIVYEIFPRSYNASMQLSSITADLDRIAALGFNAIWFMPIFPGPSTHGYAITDYRNIEEDYGTLDDFATLVDAAHERGIRIILDLVINHTAIEHPFMQDAIAQGEASNTYDFYDRDASGNHTYYYDWYSLPNLNYDNPDVWDYFLESSRWWIENYDIDGWRCDVAWGVQERNPDFWIEWRRQLKTIKPEVFLLAEADVADFGIITDRFDMAYDWSLHHNDRNSFAHLFDNTTTSGLHSRITNLGVDFPTFRYPFRFMENHDETRYSSNHTIHQTKFAATLLLTIPGVPMIYAGQEVGEPTQRDLINWNRDDQGLLDHYSKLLEARSKLPSLRDPVQTRLTNDQSATVYSYARYSEGQFPVYVALNIQNQPVTTTIQLPREEWGIGETDERFLFELSTRTTVEVTGAELDEWTVDLPGWGARVFVVSDTMFTVDTPESDAQPLTWALRQNYPNPFNPSTTIRFDVPRATTVKLTVYNLLGRRVTVLLDEQVRAGSHSVVWDGRDLSGLPVASGLYFYRMEGTGFVSSRKMLLLK